MIIDKSKHYGHPKSLGIFYTCALKTPTLIEVRKHGWPLTAVPIDQLLLWPEENIPLLLAPGGYDLHSFTANGYYKEMTKLKVE